MSIVLGKRLPPRAPAPPPASIMTDRGLSQAEKLAKQVEEDRKKRQEEREKNRVERLRRQASLAAKRAAKRSQREQKREAQMELNVLKVLQKTMMNRFIRAKLMANSVASRFAGVLKSYIDDNSSNQAEVGWLNDLHARVSQIPTEFGPRKKKRGVTASYANLPSNASTVIEANRKADYDLDAAGDLDLSVEDGSDELESMDGADSQPDDLVETQESGKSGKRTMRMYGIDSKLTRLVNNSIVNKAPKAFPTDKFGIGSDISAFFNGDKAVALGFTLGLEPESSSDGSSTRIGISMGANFKYSTSHDSEDGAVSSEHIRHKFFNKLNLTRFKVEAKKILNSKTLTSIVAMNGSNHGVISWTVPIEFWGEAGKNGKVGDAENGCAGGMYFGVYRFVPNNSYSTEQTYIVAGFWGVVGMKAEEIKAGTYDAFDINDSNMADLGGSCISNLIISGEPMIEHRELSLRSPKNDPSVPDALVKNSLGYFIVAENVDARDEFPDFEITGTLPKHLKDPELPGSSDLMARFAGKVIYTDFKNKMIHYYTKDEGRLRVRMFHDAADLNNFDYVDLHSRGVALEKRTVKAIADDLDAMTQSGADLPRNCSIESLRVDWERRLIADEGLAEIRQSNSVTPSVIPVTIENLRASYNGSRILFNMVKSYYSYFARDKAVDLAKGYTFIGEDDDDDLKQLAQRMVVPQIGVMLHAATKSVAEFPTQEEAKTKVETHLKILDNPKLDLKFNGLGKYLNEHGQAEFFKLKPHQVRALGMASQLEKGVLDIDMGGGKTLMAILLIIDRIEKLKAKGIVPRALVVMPDALIPNFYREIKKFTARDPSNKAATARMNVITLRNKNVKMRFGQTREDMFDKLVKAPPNTLMLAAYSWLGSGDNVVKILTGETRQKRNGEIEYKTEYMFPNVEDLLNKVGVNIVFLDESHKIKNNAEKGAYAHKACMALSRVKYKYIMSGTFISRTPQDMFNQVKFIDPTMLGSIADFKKRYTLDNGRNWNHEKLKELRAYIQKRGVITMRREEWLHQLPPKEERFHFVDFEHATPIVYKIFETLWDATNDEFPGEFAEALGGSISNGDNDEGSGLEDIEDTETLEDEEAAIRELQDQSNQTAQRLKSSTVAGRLMALRALVSAPEVFPIFTEAFRTVNDRMSFNVEDLLKGPKDDLVVSICREHFAPIGGRWTPLNRQRASEEEKVGKILIMSDRALIAKHMVRILKEAGYTDTDVAYYDAGHKEFLEAFCDPNSEGPSILCAVENSIKEGVNMQAASRVIRLTIPWTTGDYDQSIARAFRTGQTKPVIVDNILSNKSFEPAQLARLVTRENVNKKVTSDFDSNEFVEEITVNPTTAGPTGSFKDEFSVRNCVYASNRRVDLIALHDSIYKHEIKMSKIWKMSYLMKLVDTEEQMNRDPAHCVWKKLDLRSSIVYQGTDYFAHGVPKLILAEANASLEDKIVYVIADEQRGYAYTRDEKQKDMLRPVKISFYELEDANVRHSDAPVAGSEVMYEPWPTHGIHDNEMAVPMSDTVTEGEAESVMEKELENIGQSDRETKLRQKIIRRLRKASEERLDEALNKFLEGKALGLHNKLVSTIYDAITSGSFHPILKQSVGVAAVYSVLSGNKINMNDTTENITKSMERAAEAFNAASDANVQTKTAASPTENAQPKQALDKTINGPAKKDEKPGDETTLQVGIGDQNGIITLVVPAVNTNPSWRVLKGKVTGYQVVKDAMFYQITSESQIKSLMLHLSNLNADITNIDEFKTPEFKKICRTLLVDQKPDQTESVSVFNTVTAKAKAKVEIDLAYIVMDRKVLVICVDVTPAQRKILAAAAFKNMKPYLWKPVTNKTVAREIKKLSHVVALRNPITLASRVFKLLKIKLADKDLGL